MTFWKQCTYQYLPDRWKRLAHVLTAVPTLLYSLAWLANQHHEEYIGTSIIILLFSLILSYIIYPFYLHYNRTSILSSIDSTEKITTHSSVQTKNDDLSNDDKILENDFSNLVKYYALGSVFITVLIKLIALGITNQKISTIIGGGTILRFLIVYSLFSGRLKNSAKTKSMFFWRILLFTILIFIIQSFAGILLEIIMEEI